MYQLIIGNKNYSSWSLRPWLLMKAAGIGFEEVNVELYSDEGKEQIRHYSAAAKVPILIADDMTIWDSLAIAEFLAERHPEKALWPLASDSRAIARAVVSEMHSSFNEVRNRLPMNCRKTVPYGDLEQELYNDIERICQIWRDCREQFGVQGDFLFGDFSIADAFYAPVVSRFTTYQIPLGDIETAYVQTVLELPALKDWYAKAAEEETVVSHYEIK